MVFSWFREQPGKREALELRVPVRALAERSLVTPPPALRVTPRPEESWLLAAIREGQTMHLALTSLCRASGLQVRFCSDVEAALESIRLHGVPPVVLVESTLRAPAEGLELCRALRATEAATWLVLATPAEAVDLRIEAFRIGVDDCVSASLEAREVEALLSARLKQLERGSGVYKIGQSRRTTEEALSARAQALAGTFDLGFRETQILGMLAGGSTPKEIGARCGCSYATVRTHLRRLSKKLGCSGTRELILRFFRDD